jgi:hypothetical protein
VAALLACAVGSTGVAAQQGAPQHVIEAVDISLTPAALTAGQTTTFRLKLRNAGTRIATQVPWVLQVDGQMIANGNVPKLMPGESIEASKGWTATKGPHTATLLIDPAGVGQASGAPENKRIRQVAFNVAPSGSGSRQQEELAGFVAGEPDRGVLGHLVELQVRGRIGDARRNLAMQALSVE